MPVIYDFEKHNFTGGSLTTSFEQNVVRKKKHHIGFGMVDMTLTDNNAKEKEKERIEQKKTEQKLESHFGDGFYKFDEGHSS